MRTQLDDLQRQLGTGKKSDTYAGLGLDRGLRGRSGASSPRSAASTTPSASRRAPQHRRRPRSGSIDDIAHQVKNRGDAVEVCYDSQRPDHRAAHRRDQLDVILGLLNTSVGDRYLFSGKSSDQPAGREHLHHIMNGDGARAGLKQIISERSQADLGASGLGRLLIPASRRSVSVGEDAAGSPFGLKLASVTSTLTGATVTRPGRRRRPSVSIDLGATNPNAGDTHQADFQPAGRHHDRPHADRDEFGHARAQRVHHRRNTTATAANLQAALTTAVGKLAGTR